MWRGAREGGGGGASLVRVVAALLLLFAPALVGQARGAPRAVSGDSVRVVFWPGREARAREVLAAARAPFVLPGFPDRRAAPPSTIVLAPSAQVWDSVTGGRAPEWGAGVAFPEARVIVLPTFVSRRNDPEQLGTTLHHELVHLALHRDLPGVVPRWFDEGYAQWSSGEWDQERAWELRTAFLLGRAPPLDSLTLDWPAGEERARLAYLLSATAVRHLAERTGPQGFELLIATWKREGSLERAVRLAYGMTMGQFEQEWARGVKRRYGWLLIGAQGTVFWLVVTLLLFVLFALRRRRDRAKLAEMRAEERMLMPPRPPGLDVEYPLE